MNFQKCRIIKNIFLKTLAFFLYLLYNNRVRWSKNMRFCDFSESLRLVRASMSERFPLREYLGEESRGWLTFMGLLSGRCVGTCNLGGIAEFSVPWFWDRKALFVFCRKNKADVYRNGKWCCSANDVIFALCCGFAAILNFLIINFFAVFGRLEKIHDWY